MPSGLRTWLGPRDHVLDGGSDPPMGRGKFWGENGRPTVKNIDFLPCSVQIGYIRPDDVGRACLDMSDKMTPISHFCKRN